MDWSAPEFGQAGIYLIRNVVTDVVYIGSTRFFRQRWNQHLSKLRQGRHANRYLQNAWNKYGPDAFEWVMAEVLPLDDALLKEREIYFLDVVYPNKRQKYNVALGPVGGHRPVFSDEMRANMSAAALRRFENPTPAMVAAFGRRRGRKGKPATPEQRANLSKGFSLLHTPEARERMFEGHARRRGRPPTPRELAGIEKRTGTKWSAERRARFEERRGRPRTPAQLAGDERRRGSHHSEEHRKAIAEGMRRAYRSDPTLRTKISESTKEAHARRTPGQKAEFAAMMSAWHKAAREARNRPATLTQPALFDAEE